MKRHKTSRELEIEYEDRMLKRIDEPNQVKNDLLDYDEPDERTDEAKNWGGMNKP